MTTHSRVPAATVAIFALAAAPGVLVGGYALGKAHAVSQPVGAVAGTTRAWTRPTAPSSGTTGSSSSGPSASDSSSSGGSGSSGVGGHADGARGGQMPLVPGSGSAASGSSDLGRAADGSLVSGTPVPTGVKGVVLVSSTSDDGEGEGTGMVLTADGSVLTNYHVVEGSTAVRVTDSTTRRSWSATVVGHDATHDVAVLHLKDASNLQPVTLSQTAAELGQQVVAIGQGGGQGSLYRVSGTVSALDDAITAGDGSGADGERLTGLIRTTADVVPGYSGGPLTDTSGRVVGIDTAASSNGDIDGYAVPIAQAKAIADAIVAGARSDTVHVGAKAALGVQVTSGGPGLGGTGAYVADVVPRSAAERAGIASGSTITAVDGETVTGASDLSHDLADDYPGTRVSVTWTDPSGATHRTAVTLGTSTVA